MGTHKNRLTDPQSMLTFYSREILLYIAWAGLCNILHELVMRKPVLGVSDQVRHKLGCTAIVDGQRLEISDLDRRGIVLSMQRKQRR